MKHIAALLLLVLIEMGLRAQAPAFQWAQKRSVAYTTSFFTPGRVAAHVAAAPDNSVYYAGLDSMAQSYSTLYFGPWALERLRPDGSLMDRRVLDGKVHITQMKTSPNGTLYLLGCFLNSLRLDASNELSNRDANPHAFLAALDTAGGVLLLQDLTAGATQVTTYYNPQALLPADTCVYLGYNNSEGTAVARLGHSGSFKVLASQVRATSISDIVLGPDGTLYTTGSCVSTGAVFNGQAVTPPTSLYNQYLAAYPPGGGVGVHFLPDVTCPQPQLALAPAGDLYWTGDLHDPVNLLGHSLAGPTTGSTQDYFVARVAPPPSAAGARWAWEVPTTQSAGAGLGRFKSIQAGADGSLYLLGSSRGTLTWAPGMQTSAGSQGSMIVQKRTPDGALSWIKSVSSSLSAADGHTLTQAPDGSIYITGMARGNTILDAHTLPASATNQYYHFIARLPGTLVSAKENRKPSLWQVSPNPATDAVTVRGPEAFSVQVLNLQGQAMRPSHSGLGSLTISLRGLPAGVYLLNMKDGCGRREVRRLVRK